MKLYYLSQKENGGYDTYDSVVVAAQSPEEAVRINPSGYEWHEDTQAWHHNYGNKEKISPGWPSAWTSHIQNVGCEEIGTAKPGTKAGVIVASFNAG